MPTAAEMWGLLGAALGGGATWQLARVFLDARRGAKADEREQLALTQQAKADANTGFSSLAEHLGAALAAERAYSNEQRERLDGLQDELDAALDLNRKLARRAAGWREVALLLHQDIIDGRPPPPRDLPTDL